MERRSSNSTVNSNSGFRRLTFRGKKDKARDVGKLSKHTAKVSIPDMRNHEAESTISISPRSIVESPTFGEDASSQLQKRILKLRSNPKQNVDDAYDAYKLQANESADLCKSLLQRERRNASSIDSRNEISLFQTSSSSESHDFDARVRIVHDYIACQETLLENIRLALSKTYQNYEPHASTAQIESLFKDKAFRNNALQQMRNTSIHRILSDPPQLWHICNIRFRNYENIQADIAHIKSFKPPSAPGNPALEDIIIAENGDTILEFNSNGPAHPVYRFRVSSHMLCAVSPLFTQMLSNTTPSNRLDILSASGIQARKMLDLSPPPIIQVLKDGTSVKVYRMPQTELNKHGSLTTLLQAAHFHNEKVPKEISFPEFVSIAEVCLKYRCTSPVEERVALRWLPHWQLKATEETPDGMLLICYVFGDSELFTRVSKTAILNIKDEDDICELWPVEVRNKIKAIRKTKLEQIQNCCIMAISEYFGKPTQDPIRHSSATSLQFTSEPKCPKKDFSCDAQNLGWLLLVFHELGILPSPSIMKTEAPAELPKGSLKDLTAKLRSVGSPPLKDGHGGVCDYAPSFRSAIDDVYNSIAGLSLKDINDQKGWALSWSSNIPMADESLSLAFDELPGETFCGSDGDSSTLQQSLRQEINNTSSPNSPLNTSGSESQSHTPVSEDIDNTHGSSLPLPSDLQSATHLSEAEMEHILWPGPTSQPSTPPPSELPLGSPTSRFSRSVSSSSSNVFDDNEIENQKYLFKSNKEIMHVPENKFLRDEDDRRFGVQDQ